MWFLKTCSKGPGIDHRYASSSLVGGVECRSLGDERIGRPETVVDDGRKLLLLERTHDGLQDLQRCPQVAVTLLGDVRRGVRLAEQRQVDRFRRRARGTHAHDPQERHVEVAVAAVQADDQRIVRGEVAGLQHAELAIRVAPPALGRQHAEFVAERRQHLGEDLSDVATRVDRPPRVDLALDDPMRPHIVPLPTRSTLRGAGYSPPLGGVHTWRSARRMLITIASWNSPSHNSASRRMPSRRNPTFSYTAIARRLNSYTSSDSRFTGGSSISSNT